MSAYQQLEKLFTKLSHLDHVSAITNWDEAVMMPPGGGSARAEAMGTLSVIAHELLCQSHTSDLLKQAEQESLNNPWQQSNLEWMRKQYQLATCLPADLVEKMAAARMTSEQAWRELRAANNWKDFLPHLDRNFKLVREAAAIQANLLQLNTYDVLLDEYSPGVSQAFIDPIFSALKQQLPELIQRITEKQKTENCIIPKGNFAIDKQREIGLALMRAIGFNFQHGRLDVSHHPFCGGVPDDVRITTRYRQDEFITAAMGICHETGHACYEQHLPKKWRNQPVGKALGMSVHESQSLLIEMQACRSPEFMTFMAPLVQQQFGEDEAFTPTNLFYLYTRVKPNLIRVDADEITYPLHIIMRYEIERDLFSNNITVNDLPDIWQQKTREYFNLDTKNNYRDGVMQDVHWPAGIFGYFPAYTLGRLIGAQLYHAALQAEPNIPKNLAQGDFTLLMNWLKKHVHERASSTPMQQLLMDVTGSELSAEYFIDHIKQRYL